MSSELKSAHIAPVVWVNPAEFELCQTTPIIMNEHNELLNGMPRQIAALAARTDHCCLALTPITPPAAQVQGEREGFEHRYPYVKGLGFDGKRYVKLHDGAWQVRAEVDANLQWNAWQAHAALSAPPAAGVPEGYKWYLVPKEDTDAFNAACSAANDAYLGGIGPCGVFIAGYRAMLAAAPTPPQENER